MFFLAGFSRYLQCLGGLSSFAVLEAQRLHQPLTEGLAGRLDALFWTAER
jgi:hypothetical protein